jgi:hypothetical protein
MPTLEKADGTMKSVEDLTDELMESLEEKSVTISGRAFDDLEVITRYNNRDTIQVRGDKWFDKNHDALVSDVLTQMLTDKARNLSKYLEERRISKAWDLVRDLVSHGVPQNDAISRAFPDGVPAPKKK